MSCYHPTSLLIYFDEFGEQHGYWTPFPYHPENDVIYNADSRYVISDGHRVWKSPPRPRFKIYDVKPCPCGKCIGCRLDFSRRWADRMTLELDHTCKGFFLTLTYNDENLPHSSISPDDTLVYEHLQLFFKRFLEHCSRRFPGREVRRYAAGEYGEKSGRPHYHAIVFGLDLDDIDDKILLGFNEFHQPFYSSPWIEKIWSFGFITIANVSWQTCAYVSRYVLKKQIGKTDFYDFLGIEPERALMSRRPGISSYYIPDHYEYFMDTDRYIINSVPVSDKFGAVPKKNVNLPIYLVNKLDEVNPILYNNIKETRSRLAHDQSLLELCATDLSFENYMLSKEMYKLAQIKALNKCAF